jgi:hypothetical protein
MGNVGRHQSMDGILPLYARMIRAPDSHIFTLNFECASLGGSQTRPQGRPPCGGCETRCFACLGQPRSSRDSYPQQEWSASYHRLHLLERHYMPNAKANVPKPPILVWFL